MISEIIAWALMAIWGTWIGLEVMSLRTRVAELEIAAALENELQRRGNE